MKLKTIVAVAIFLYCFYLMDLLSSASIYDKEVISDRTVIEQVESDYTIYLIPSYSGFKSYMPYTLFSKKSDQYKLQTICTTDSDGFRRYNDYYVVALGSFFGKLKVGQRVDLILENGEQISCVLGDFKADKDTDARGLFTANTCMSEFIVDSKTLKKAVKRAGDASYLKDSWMSPVCEVRIYDDNVLG